MNMSVFFVDCPKIPCWSVLSLICCRFFKIYKSYISKCRSAKMINIHGFWSRIFSSCHSKVISVQSWECLRNNYSPKPTKDKFVSPESILSRTSLCSYFVSWKIYLLLSHLQKNRLDEQHRNNYSIPHKIWPVQEQIKIILIFSFF